MMMTVLCNNASLERVAAAAAAVLHGGGDGDEMRLERPGSVCVRLLRVAFILNWALMRVWGLE